MSVMEMKMERLAQRTECRGEAQHARQGEADRGFDFDEEVRWQKSSLFQIAYVLGRVASGKRPANLTNAHMPHIDTGASPSQRPDGTEEIGELAGFQAGGIFDEEQGTAVDCAQKTIELVGGAQVFGSSRYQGLMIVEDETIDLAGCVSGQFRDLVAMILAQEIEFPGEVDDYREMGSRPEFQHPIQLGTIRGMDFGAQSGLEKSEPCQFEERIVTFDASLEQAQDSGPTRRAVHVR